MAIPLGPLDPAYGIRIGGCQQRAAHDTAQIVRNHIVVADPVPIAMDAVEEFDELNRLDDKACFLEDLPRHRLAERFTHINESTGDGPFALRGLGAALHQQNAPLLDDHRAHAHQRCYWKFSLQHLSRFMVFAVSAIRGTMIMG